MAAPLPAQKIKADRKTGKQTLRLKNMKKGQGLTFDHISPKGDNGCYIVEDGDSMALLYILDSLNLQWFDRLDDVGENYVRVLTRGKYGIVDIRTNAYVVKPLCESIDRYDDAGNYLIELNGKWVENVNGVVNELTIPPAVFTHPQIMPLAIDCEGEKGSCTKRAMLETIYGNVRVANLGSGRNRSGTGILTFTVTETGEVAGFNFTQPNTVKLERASIAAIEPKLGPFQPGYQDGRPVATKYVIPVVVSVQITTTTTYGGRGL